MKKTVSQSTPLTKTNKYVYSFQKLETMKSFAKNIWTPKINLDNAGEDQSHLWLEIFVYIGIQNQNF